MTTSKSPLRILLMAHEIGTSGLHTYAHRFSPKKFTQPQLFACLVLKEFLKLTYRGLSAVLNDARELCEAIGLTFVPHFTTFQKASRRLFTFRRAKRLLHKTVRHAVSTGVVKPTVSLAALDATGLESHHASEYYVRRKAKGGKSEQKLTYTRFPKFGLVCDSASHFILALVPALGPGPDILHFGEALDQALANVGINALAADAGYDSEASHEYARYHRHVRSFIPALIGRPTEKPPSGYWRRQMKARLHLTRYSQRWQAETVNSMIKRLLGSALTARTYWSQCREMLLMAITLDIMILAATCHQIKGFLQSKKDAFFTIVVGHLRHQRHFAHARAAPCGPEVENHDLALLLLQAQVAALEQFQFHIRGGLTDQG